MGTRRVLACVRQARAVRSLVVTEEVLPVPAPGEVLVQVACAVVDPEPILAGCTPDIPEGAFIGTVRTGSDSARLQPGDWVAGVGPLADFATVSADRLQPLAADAGFARDALALLPLFDSVVSALGDAGIAQGDRVLISGRGLAARLVEQVAEIHTGSAPHTLLRGDPPNRREDFSFDILIDTTADSSWWPRVLSLVREQGRVLLLLPPGPQVHPLDFYPAIHRRSLRLLARRVPSTGGQSTSMGEGSRIRQQLLDEGLVRLHGLLAEVRVGAQPSSSATIHLDAVAEGHGLVCWFEDGKAGVDGTAEEV